MKKTMLVGLLLISLASTSQELLKLDNILSIISLSNPSVKTYDAQIRSLNESAKGARNWDAPQFSTGFWMTPYNPKLWKQQPNGTTGMGQYMVSAEQMFPNKKSQDAEEKYLQSLSSVESEKKNVTLNDLYASAKQNYVQLIINKKKLRIVVENAKLLDFMIKNAELRYQNNAGKISAYYKVKASNGNNEKLRIMLENEAVQKRILLNTLMNRDKGILFDIDTNYLDRNMVNYLIDNPDAFHTRSDIKAIDKNIQATTLEQDAERAKLKPEFGIRYDHMFGFGGLPMQYSLMGTVRLPMAKWSSRASNATIESLKWKSEFLHQQKLAMINEAAGMAFGMKSEIISRQKEIKLFEENIIPALSKNFQTMQLAYEQNTEELFTLYDSWESLNDTELDYMDQLQQLLLMQVELERILEVK